MRLGQTVLAVACVVLTVSSQGEKPDCVKEGDGFYVQGCNAAFWRCSRGVAYTQVCPSNLFFNNVKRKCDYKEKISLCVGEQSHTHTPQIQKAIPQFDCIGKANEGPFPPIGNDCPDYYIQCSPVGEVLEQNCPYNQYFDAKAKLCDYMEKNAACVKKEGSKIGATINRQCKALIQHQTCDEKTQHCENIGEPKDGGYQCKHPLSVWYGPQNKPLEWKKASSNGLRCGANGKWMDEGVDISDEMDSAVCRADIPKEVRARIAAAMVGACPPLFTGGHNEDLPCEDDEICQRIERPTNGRYSCPAPFSVWYGPHGLTTADKWTKAEKELVCGHDGFWYDGDNKVMAKAIDCTAPKSAFMGREAKKVSSCPPLHLNTKDVPCDENTEICNLIGQPIGDKYMCETPYKVWYGPRGKKNGHLWKSAIHALECKDGSWWDGETKIDAQAVDCTANKIDCGRLADGKYNGEAGKCSSFFWECEQSHTYLQPCQAGTFFDDFTKSCDYKELIESCGGRRPSTAPPLPSTPLPIGAPAPPPSFTDTKNSECPSLITDVSLIPCSAHHDCLHINEPVNQRYLCEAPYKLSWGPKNKESEWKTSESGLICVNGIWKDGENEVNGDNAVQCITEKLDCSGKEDGSYLAHSDACSSFFWNCANNEAFLYRCPSGLFYDIEEKKCDYKEVITVCGGRKIPSVTTPKPSLDSPSTPSSSPSPPSFDCSSKEDGYHSEQPCTRRFWNCADKKSYPMECPEGLVYDERVKMCQYPPSCSSPLPEKKSVLPKTLDHPNNEHKKLTTSFDCTHQSDGLYSEKKCYQQYAQCTNGRSYALECPSSLVYNDITQGCDYTESCLSPPSSTPPPSADISRTTISSGGYGLETPVSPVPARAPIPPPQQQFTPSCEKLEDGVHALSRCGRGFFQCWQGATTVSQCNDGLFFNAKTGQCDFRENVQECGGASDIPFTSSTQSTTTVHPPSAPPPKEVDNFCEKQLDGAYPPKGCMSFFYNCHSGKTHKMVCPIGLFYDADTKACGRREEIVICGGKKIAPVSTSSPVTTPSADVPKDNFCMGKKDGTYAIGCSPFYYSCSSEYTVKIPCPANLVYDEATQMCTYSCGMTSSSSPLFAPSTPAYGTSAIPLPSTVSPLSSPPVIDSFCQGKTNGFYGQGCSEAFYNCQSGVTHKMSCPVDLQYDEQKRACSHKEFILACGGKKIEQTTVPTPSPVPSYGTILPSRTSPILTVPPVPVEHDFCQGKTNGFYSQGCSDYFYSCQEGTTYKMTCPTGLHYDEEVNACDHKSTINACGGKMIKQTTTTASPIPSRDVSVLPKDNFCEGKENGFHGDGCSNHFYSCQDAITHKLDCPAGLHYNEELSMCDHQSTIPACGAKTIPSANPISMASPTQQSTSSYGTPINHSPTSPSSLTVTPHPPVVSVTTFCKSKADGYYGFGCQNFFFNCQNGVTYRMNCPPGLHYDPVGEACDHKENIIACGAQKTQSTTVPSPTVYSTPFTQSTPPPSLDVPIDTFCKGKVDGYYGFGCQTFFYNCRAEITSKMICAAGLHYDVDFRSCDHKENIVACGGVKPTTSLPIPVPAQSNPSSYGTVQSVDNFCQDKTNGYHGQGCQEFFYFCQDGVAKKMLCASNLHYDIEEKKCNRKELIVECGGRKETPSSPVAAPSTLPGYGSTPVQVDTFCTGKVNGFYGLGCAKFFYQCQGGESLKMTCPAELHYDKDRKTCEDKTLIPECGGKRMETTTRSFAPPPLPSKIDLSCSGKQDGMFGDGCKETFYSCMNEQAYEMHCPRGLIYDDSKKSCDYKEHIFACGGQTPTTPSFVPSSTVPPVRDIAALTKAPDAPCIGKKDGIHPIEECSDAYLYCQSGNAAVQKCVTGLFYNKENAMCDYKEKVKGCAIARDVLPPRAVYGTVVHSTTPRPIPHLTTVAVPPKVNPYKAPMTKRPIAHSVTGTSCAALDDGYYAQGCSGRFTACVDGKSIDMDCPSSLVFSSISHQCDSPDNVKECTGVAADVTKTVTAVPPPVIRPVSPSISHANADYNRVQTTTPPSPQRDVHPQCAGRSNGIYSFAPCTQNYLACVDEKATIGLCRDDLWYNAQSGLCDWKEKIVACGVTTPAPIQTIRPLTTVHSTIRSLPRIRSPPFDCSRRRDGKYAVSKCSPFYHKCVNGAVVSRGTCTDNSIINPATGRCEHISNIPSCAPAIPQPPPPQMPPPQSYAPSLSQPSPVPVYGVVADPRQFCYLRPDGIYGNNCGQGYIICRQSATFPFECPPQFAFNRDRSVCEHPSRIAQCGLMNSPPVYEG